MKKHIIKKLELLLVNISRVLFGAKLITTVYIVLLKALFRANIICYGFVLPIESYQNVNFLTFLSKINIGVGGNPFAVL